VDGQLSHEPHRFYDLARLTARLVIIGNSSLGQHSKLTTSCLESIPALRYCLLLKIDLDMKTGGMPGDVAFEVLIAELTG